MAFRFLERGSIGGGCSPSTAPLSRTIDTSSRPSSMESSACTANTDRRLGSVATMLPESSITNTNCAARAPAEDVPVCASAAMDRYGRRRTARALRRRQNIKIFMVGGTPRPGPAEQRTARDGRDLPIETPAPGFGLVRWYVAAWSADAHRAEGAGRLQVGETLSGITKTRRARSDPRVSGR